MYSNRLTFYMDPLPLSVYITGPSTAPCATGTWTANVSGGYPPCTYEWFYKWDCGNNDAIYAEGKNIIQPYALCDTWMPINGANSATLNFYLCGGDCYLRVDVRDATMQFVEAEYFVAGVGGIEPKLAANIEEGKNFNAVPGKFDLFQNYPNPFNPSTSISFSIPVKSFVTLKVYNVLGDEVAVLINDYRERGNYMINFDASELPSGVYIYQIRTNAYTQSKKMLLIK